MRLRCCVLFCVVCGMASADETQDYFSKAFRRAVPSPFSQQVPDRGIYGFDSKEDLSKLAIIQKQALVQPKVTCAIPLLEMQVPRDREFLIRKFPTGEGQRIDPNALIPAPPVCQP